MRTVCNSHLSTFFIHLRPERGRKHVRVKCLRLIYHGRSHFLRLLLLLGFFSPAWFVGFVFVCLSLNVPTTCNCIPLKDRLGFCLSEIEFPDDNNYSSHTHRFLNSMSFRLTSEIYKFCNTNGSWYNSRWIQDSSYIAEQLTTLLS